MSLTYRHSRRCIQASAAVPTLHVSSSLLHVSSPRKGSTVPLPVMPTTVTRDAHPLPPAVFAVRLRTSQAHRGEVVRECGGRPGGLWRAGRRRTVRRGQAWAAPEQVRAMRTRPGSPAARDGGAFAPGLVRVGPVMRGALRGQGEGHPQPRRGRGQAVRDALLQASRGRTAGGPAMKSRTVRPRAVAGVRACAWLKAPTIQVREAWTVSPSKMRRTGTVIAQDAGSPRDGDHRRGAGHASGASMSMSGAYCRPA